MPNAIQSPQDPGTKDSLPVSAIPPIPPRRPIIALASDATTNQGGLLEPGTRVASVITFADGDPIALGVKPGDVLHIIASSGGTTLADTDHVIASVANDAVTVETVFGGGEDTAIAEFRIERRFFTLDNVMFSNVQKRPARFQSLAGRKDAIFMRLPGLVTRPIRPRKFIQVGTNEIYQLRAVTVRSSGTNGSVTTLLRTLTSTTATFVTDGVRAGDVVILSTAGTSNGRYVVATVVSETVLRLDRPTPETIVTSAVFAVITANNFVDAANKLIAFGALEVRDPAGSLVDPILPL